MLGSNDEKYAMVVERICHYYKDIWKKLELVYVQPFFNKKFVASSSVSSELILIEIIPPTKNNNI